MGEGFRLIGSGLLLAVKAAAFLSHWPANALSAIRARDPLTYLLVAAALLVAGLAACWIPAWRATRIDPLTALPVE